MGGAPTRAERAGVRLGRIVAALGVRALGVVPLGVRALGVVAAGGIAAGGIAPSVAHAQLALAWEVPAEAAERCPTTEQVDAEVQRLLGEAASPSEALPVRAEVTLLPADAAAPERWQLRLRVGEEGDAGERTLEGESCRAVAEAAALIVALTIEPELVPPAEPSPLTGAPPEPLPAIARAEPPEALSDPAEPVEREPVPDEPPAEPAPEEPPAEPPPADPAPTEPPPGPIEPAPAPRRPPPTLPRPWALHLAIGLEAGVLPGPSPSLELGADLPLGRRARLRLSAATALPREASGPLGRATLGWLTARAALVGTWAAGPFLLGPLAELEVGALGGRGAGVSNPLAGWSAWLAVGGGAFAAVPLGSRVTLGLEASARVPLWRPAYVIEPAGEVHQAAPVVGRAALRLRLEFP